MEHTWRWFGGFDPTTLKDIRQADATGIVTALHEIDNGEIWPRESILERLHEIENAGLRWSVVESVPVHEDIKRKVNRYEEYIDNYKQTLRNLAQCGINLVCYNFMPVLDWTRTDIAYELSNGAKTLRFDQKAIIAFDLFILQRPGAELEYTQAEITVARKYFKQLGQQNRKLLTETILAGLPGAEEKYTLKTFRKAVSNYKEIDEMQLRKNLTYFLNEVIPVAEEVGIRMAIHPDDPPFPIFGLPKIVSTSEHLDWLLTTIPSDANGLTFCTGSFGVRKDNNLIDMIARYSNRIYFVHLRSTQREKFQGSFHEASHLDGDADLVEIIRLLLEEEKRRAKSDDFSEIPMRPDHGHQILDDLKKSVKPGYSALGRMKGLAEIRGIELALKRIETR